MSGSGEFPSSKILFTHDLHDYALVALAIELSVEDLLPWAEVELACGDGDNDFVVNQESLEV
jgi:hypothetical protein